MSGSAAPAPKQVTQAEAPDAARVMTLFVMIVATLYFGKEVLVPVTLALLLAFLLAPLVGLLRRAHLGRVPSVLLGVIVALGIILAIGGVIGSQIAQLATNLPQYAPVIESKVARVRHYTVGELSSLADRVGAHQSAPAAHAATPGHAVPAAAPAAAPAAQPAASPLEMAQRYLSPILSPLATLGIVFIVAVFALLQAQDLRDRLIRLLGSDDLHRTTLAIDDGGQRLSKYFLTQLCINTAFGVIVGLGLLVIGVPNPVLFGILSGLLRFVPYVGSLLSAVLPMTLAAAVEPGWSMLIWTGVMYLVVEGVTGQVIEPMVYGHSTGLSPFSVVVAAIFWSWLWGPVGLILSTPLTLCLVVIGRHVKRLEFLDVLLGDREALTPVESFYQRMLAGDADEAQDHAELLLKERSLSTYYDEVALKGLQLAANDAQRGVLNHAQLDEVRVTITTLVHSLQSHDDNQPPPPKGEDNSVSGADNARDLPINPLPANAPEIPPHPWSEGQAVLCIAGRGPLDEAASAMLVQLLGKHGMSGRLVGYAEAGREHIDMLDISGARMVCISYLDISGSPAHLRYLMQRLRRRLAAGTPILVGLWPAEDSALTNPAIRAQVGADYFSSSLADAVSSCADAAGKERELRSAA